MDEELRALERASSESPHDVGLVLRYASALECAGRVDRAFDGLARALEDESRRAGDSPAVVELREQLAGLVERRPDAVLARLRQLESVLARPTADAQAAAAGLVYQVFAARGEPLVVSLGLLALPHEDVSPDESLEQRATRGLALVAHAILGELVKRWRRG